MKTNKRKRAKEIQSEIRQVLFNDWDPFGINGNSNLIDEYDSYIAPIYRILVGSRLENELIECLFYSGDELFGNDSDVNNLTDRLEENYKSIVKKLLKINTKL